MVRARVALVLLLSVPLPALAGTPQLEVDVARTAAVTGAALALWGGAELAKPALAPAACRWCEPPGLDRSVRESLRWSDPGAARLLSDGAAIAVPASLAVADLVLSGGDARRAGEDALVALEAIALAEVATQVAKYAVGRRRPSAWAAGARADRDDDLSFFSAHASSAFAAAGAFGTLAHLRGYRGWPIVYAAGFAGAAAVGYFRVAADKHWLTDVGAGALVGAAIGVAVPLLLHRAGGGAGGVAVTPAPLGFAIVFPSPI